MSDQGEDHGEGGFFSRMAGGSTSSGAWAWDPESAPADGAGTVDPATGMDAAAAVDEVAGADPVPRGRPSPVDFPDAPVVRDATDASAEPGPAADRPVPHHSGGRFDHRGHEGEGEGDDDASPGVGRPVLAAAVAFVLLAAAGVWWVAIRDDGDAADVEVAGTTVTRPTVTEPSTSTVVDPARSSAYAAEVQRACAAITADPGLVTESVLRWDPAWAEIGQTERGLRDEVNNCALPAREAAMATMAASEEAERVARVAACGQFDGAQLAADASAASGRCGIVGLRVEDRREGSCELVGRWDASGSPPAGGSGSVAVLRSGAGGRCPLIDGLAVGWTGRVWVTVGGTVDHDGGPVPLLVVDQAEPAS